MKYPEYRLSMEAALPSSVQSWLGQQLELRGIDSLVYTRYIISLLQQEPEDQDGYDNEIDSFFTPKLDSKRWRCKKLERKKYNISEEEKKKKAAIECLTAISEEKCGIEQLVEELCSRLKETELQVSVSPFVNIQSSSSSYESSEDSGPEFKNPAQRYYAAFPDLHGNKNSTNFSPSVTSKGSIWKKNPLVKPCSGDDQAENATASADDTKPSEKTDSSPNQSVGKNNMKKKDGRYEKQRPSSKSYQSKPSRMRREKERPQRRSRSRKADRIPSWAADSEKVDFDPFLIPDNFEQFLIENNELFPNESENPKRENEDLCTKVESILKGMLLPTPSKTYKELEDVSEGEPKEQLERYDKQKSPSQPSVSREDSFSPEHQEQDFWYTQPIDIIFQSQEDSTVPTKERLYKRISNPDSQTESGREDSASTSSSPVVNRTRNDSTASDEDDIWAGSVLIPAWLTDELSIDQDEILPGSSLFSSSFKSSSPNEDVLSNASKKNGLEGNFGDLQDPFPTEVWSIPNSLKENTVEAQTWSNNDSDEYLTPTPTQDLLIISHQNWFSPAAPVSLIDVNYLSSLTNQNIDSQFDTASLVDRTPCLSSLWHSQVLFDVSLYNNEESNCECEGLESHRSIWQFEKEYYGDNLAKLWNVNMQKRCKGQIWGSDLDSNNHLWVGENAFVMNDTRWNNTKIVDVVKQQPVDDFENTLIPEIFIQIFNEEVEDDDDVFEDFETDNVKPLYDRSLSMNNVPSLWSSESKKGPNPELSKSFELVPSETSAFEDVPRKLHHVLSEPNLAKYRTEKESVQPSPQEHLYFSPKTHFRPITPAYAPELCTSSKSKQHEVCNDLFGGVTSSKTPYQQYVTDPTSDDESFVPKFKVKNYNKYIQTGTSMENGGVSISPEENPLYEEELSTPENLAMGMIEDMINDTDAMEDYLIRVYEDLDAANNDSAYETDYGISTAEPERENYNGNGCQHQHNCQNLNPEKHVRVQMVDQGSLGEKFGYGIDSFEATYPHFNDWPDMFCYSQDHMTSDDLNNIDVEKQFSKSWHEPSFYHPELWTRGLECDDASNSLDNHSTRALDSNNTWSYGDDDQLYLMEKYKNVWSTGQENTSHVDSSEQEFLYVEKLFDQGQAEAESKEIDLNLNEHFFEMNDCHDEQCMDGRVNPVLEKIIDSDQGALQDSFFSVKLVNKDKLRQSDEDEDECREHSHRNSYGSYDLMPMPNEALLSSELEKQWTSPEMQLLLSQHKHSRFQRKPCSFFLEGNCRRSDCKFAHDISNITCRFWEEGGCFKGPLCPFLHGYRSEPVKKEESEPVDKPKPTTPGVVVKDREKFEFHSEEFPELSSLKVNMKRSKSGRSQNSSSSISKKEKQRRGSNSRRNSNKENLPETKKD